MSGIYAEAIARAMLDRKEPSEDYTNIVNDISKGYVVIKYEKSMLKEADFLEGRIKMLIPDIFDLMDEKMVMLKYPDPYRPQCIYGDNEGLMSIIMSLEEGEVEIGAVENITNLLSREMYRLYPSSKIEDKEMITEDKSWFSLDIPLVDDKCCHMMYFCRISTGLIMGTFDCSVDSKKVWKPIVRQLIETIREECDSSGEYINND